MDANTESKQTYYLLHISYTNSEISIDLPNICAPLFDDSYSMIFLLFHFGPCRGKFVDIPI